MGEVERSYESARCARLTLKKQRLFAQSSAEASSPIYPRVMREQMREQQCLRPCNPRKHLTSGGGGVRL